MDKNNDIQVNKVSKWDKDIAEESLWQAKKSVDAFLCGYSPVLSIEALDAVRTIYVYLDEALDRFNELEARHQKDTGMISDYAEENARLKQRNEKASNNIRDLRQVLEENDIATYLNPVTVSWGVANVALQKKTEHFNTQLDNLRERLREAERNKEDALRKMIQEVTELEKEKIELEDRLTQEKRKDTYVILRNHNTIYDLKAEIRGLESELKQVIELAKSYGIIIHDERKDAKPYNAVNIGMCGYYYVLDGCAEKESKDIRKLVDKIKQLEKKNEELSSQVSNLKIENKNLKNKLDIMTDENDCLITRVFKQDEEYTKLEAEHKKLQETHELCMKAHLRLCDDSTKLAAENDDLRQERDKYSYRLEKLGQALEERGIHCRWFEVSLEWHLYEGESFEELNRKIQRLEKENKGLKKHYEEELRIREKEKDEKDKLIDELNSKFKVLKLSTNMMYGCYGYGLNTPDELNRKIEELKKENEELKTTLALCERDANMARELCHTVAFNAEYARNNKEEK